MLWFNMEIAVIKVTDGETVLEFGFDDLIRFHGTRSICGLTHHFDAGVVVGAADLGPGEAGHRLAALEVAHPALHLGRIPGRLRSQPTRLDVNVRRGGVLWHCVFHILQSIVKLRLS